MRRLLNKCLLLLLFSYYSFAQTNVNGIIASASIKASNSRNTTIGVVGQPFAVSMLKNDNNVSFSGFMDTFVMFPTRDADNDGVPDESSKDNDGDTIDDVKELEGTAFSPITPTNPQLIDSDWDGVTDQIELIAGTDPTDPTSYLQISDVNITDQDFIIYWQGRANIDYQVLLYTNLLFTNDVFVSPTISSTNGTGSWETTWLSWTNNIDIDAKYYRINVIQ